MLILLIAEVYQKYRFTHPGQAQDSWLAEKQPLLFMQLVYGALIDFNEIGFPRKTCACAADVRGCCMPRLLKEYICHNVTLFKAATADSIIISKVTGAMALVVGGLSFATLPLLLAFISENDGHASVSERKQTRAALENLKALLPAHKSGSKISQLSPLPQVRK